MRRNLWLTGVGGFTIVLFGFLAYFNYEAYTVRRENYYLAGVLVFGTITVLTVYAVINGWRGNAPPGRQPPEPYDEEDAEPRETPGADD
jgi:hypothetical protein